MHAVGSDTDSEDRTRKQLVPNSKLTKPQGKNRAVYPILQRLLKKSMHACMYACCTIIALYLCAHACCNSLYII